MKELNIEAKIENLKNVNDFLSECFENAGCSMKMMMQLELVTEELFANVCNYAYDDAIGMICIGAEAKDGMLSLTFTDSGKPYDPLKKEDPDITLSAEDRPIGGLGVFMVKNIMDDVSYEYKDGKNILTVKKKIG